MGTEATSVREMFDLFLAAELLDPEYAKAELQNIGPANAIGYLSEILAHDQRKRARLVAAFALGATGDPSAIPPLVQALTQETDLEIRARAALELGRIRCAEAIPFLVKALREDGDETVCCYAAQALGEIGLPEAIPALSQVLREDRRELVCGNAAMALGAIGLPEAIPALSQVLPNHEGDAARMIIEALANIGDPKAIPIVAKAVDDALDWAIRYHAIKALGTIKHADAVPYLGKALVSDTSRSNRQAAVEALAQMGYATAFPYICTALAEDKDPDTRQKAAIALATVAQDQSIPALNKCVLEDESDTVREAAAEALGLIRHVDGVAALCQALEADQSENVRGRAAVSLGEIGDMTAIPVLSKVLAQDKCEVARSGIVYALSKLDHVDTITPLVKTLLEDDGWSVRHSAAVVLQAKSIVDWQAIANHIVQALQQGKKQRSDVDATLVLLAMQPPQAELDANSHLRTDFLIEKALDQDDRVTAILAKLIIDSASESVLLAGERINNYEKTHQTPPDKFRKLRIEIGGETALDPVMQVLQGDLQTYFRKPISELNQLTQSNWQKTVLYAQYGFLARITMSVVVFIVGMVLLSISSGRVMFGKLDQAQLFGSGVSFVSGLGSMLLIIYRGPLREIRESVNDLAIASAAFIAYIHRVLQISHTFSFHYLKQQITFEAVEKSSKLIRDAMDDTTGRLQASQTEEQRPTATKKTA